MEQGKLIKNGNHYYSILLIDNKELLATTENVENVLKLSLKNCEAIENGYDLGELAKSEAIKISETEVRDEKLERIYKRGFRKALEIIGDKKFNEEDIKKTFECGMLVYGPKPFNQSSEHKILNKQQYIQSLQQTEWDVEIVMETPAATYGHSGWHKQPKLDKDGCLILKRI